MQAIHLIDDRRMGGVTRFLQQLTTLRPDDRTEFCKRGTMRAKSYGAKLIVSHLAISWRSLPMLIALRACNPKARLIHIEHSYCEGFERHRVTKQGRFRALLRAAYGLFDDVICVSAGQGEWMEQSGLLPSGKRRIAPPLVDLEPFLALEDPAFDGPRRFGFVGRLDEQKGLDIVVRAWRNAPPENATLEIFGDGPMRDALEKLAGGDACIRFHGRTDSPATAYKSIDIALMPSRWEPYGLSCLEARAAGRPVLIASVDGLPEQMRGGGGMSVGNDEAAWQTALNDKTLAASLKLAVGVGRRSALNDKARAVAFWQALSPGAVPAPQSVQAIDGASVA